MPRFENGSVFGPKIERRVGGKVLMDGSVIDISSVKRAHHITFLLSNCCICGMEYWDKTFCYYSICKKYVITLHTCDSTAVWRECRTSQCVFAIKPNRGLCTYSMYLHTF